MSLVPVKVVVEQESHSDIEVGPFNQGVAIEVQDFQFISVIDVASSKTCLTLPINDIRGRRGRIFVQAVKTEEAER